MKINASFIFATPLQILIGLGLIKQLNLGCKVELLVVGYFSEANQVAARLSEKFKMNYDVHYFNRYEEAIDYVVQKNRSRIFVHWDIGYRTNIFLRKIYKHNLNNEVNVYEEGLGTYRVDIYSWLKKIIIKLIGLPIILGQSKYTKRIYVYEPMEYRRISKNEKEVIKIRHNVTDVINFYSAQIDYVFNTELFFSNNLLRGVNCALYLTSWAIDEKFLKFFKEKSGFLIVKPHPHIKNTYASVFGNIANCPARIPAELLIKKLSENFEHVEVYHHGSSVERYVNLSNVCFKKIIQ